MGVSDKVRSVPGLSMVANTAAALTRSASGFLSGTPHELPKLKPAGKLPEWKVMCQEAQELAKRGEREQALMVYHKALRMRPDAQEIKVAIRNLTSKITEDISKSKETKLFAAMKNMVQKKKSRRRSLTGAAEVKILACCTPTPADITKNDAEGFLVIKESINATDQEHSSFAHSVLPKTYNGPFPQPVGAKSGRVTLPPPWRLAVNLNKTKNTFECLKGSPSWAAEKVVKRANHTSSKVTSLPHSASNVELSSGLTPHGDRLKLNLSLDGSWACNDAVSQPKKKKKKKKRLSEHNESNRNVLASNDKKRSVLPVISAFTGPSSLAGGEPVSPEPILKCPMPTHQEPKDSVDGLSTFLDLTVPSHDPSSPMYLDPSCRPSASEWDISAITERVDVGSTTWVASQVGQPPPAADSTLRRAQKQLSKMISPRAAILPKRLRTLPTVCPLRETCEGLKMSVARKTSLKMSLEDIHNGEASTLDQGLLFPSRGYALDEPPCRKKTKTGSKTVQKVTETRNNPSIIEESIIGVQQVHPETKGDSIIGVTVDPDGSDNRNAPHDIYTITPENTVTFDCNTTGCKETEGTTCAAEEPLKKPESAQAADIEAKMKLQQKLAMEKEKEEPRPDSRTASWQQEAPEFLVDSTTKLESPATRSGGRGTSSREYVLTELKRVNADYDEERYEKCRYRSEKAIEMVQDLNIDQEDFTEQDRQNILANLYSCLGNACLELGLVEQALDAHLNDLHIANQCGLLSAKSRALSNVGRVHARAGRFRDAIDVWNDKVALVTSAEERAWLFHEIGRCYYHVQEYADAQLHAEKAWVNSQEVNDIELQFKASLLLAECYEKLEAFGEALMEYKNAFDFAVIFGDDDESSRINETIQNLNRRIARSLVASRETARPVMPQIHTQDETRMEIINKRPSEALDDLYFLTLLYMMATVPEF